MPEKGVPAPFGALPAHFFHRPEKSQKCQIFAYFPWWAHGPYSPGLGPIHPRHEWSSLQCVSSRGDVTFETWLGTQRVVKDTMDG